jgi:hypothetical protein
LVREPASFLALGTAPTGRVPYSPFCYWCGRNDASVLFQPVEFAIIERHSQRQYVHRRARETACEACFDWIKRKKVQHAKELEGKTELERLAWMGERLMIRGQRLRQAAVDKVVA